MTLDQEDSIRRLRLVLGKDFDHAVAYIEALNIGSAIAHHRDAGENTAFVLWRVDFQRGAIFADWLIGCANINAAPHKCI